MPPGIDAAYTMDVQVDVQIDKTAALDFMGMTDAFEILFAVVPCSYAERLQTIDSKGFLPIGDGEPPDICTAAIVLRMDVFGLIFRQWHLIPPEEGAALAVGVVFPRATSKILDVGKVCRQAHPHAQLGEQWLVSASGTVVQFYEDAVVIDDGVSHRDIGDLFV